MIFKQGGLDIADKLRDLPTGTKSASEVGWDQGFDGLTELLRSDIPE